MVRTRDLTGDDVEAAGALLAARHAAHRRAEPLLPARFEDPRAAAALVRAALDAGATGAVAESVAESDGGPGGEPGAASGAASGSEVTGFLLGAAKAAASWGPNVWVESAGHAARDAETVRDLYAHAAAAWVEQGRTAHYALVPAHDPALVDAWFRLGFGQQHVHALREVPTRASPPVAGVLVRPVERRDIPVLAELDVELPRHQGRSPVFAAPAAVTHEEAVEDWEASFDDARYWSFAAEVDGQVVGCATGCALELSSAHTGPARPERAGFLGFAAVLPAARGRGVGRALGEAVLDRTAALGLACAVTDWRATNLLSSRTWPRLGFRPTFLRLHRLVGY